MSQPVHTPTPWGDDGDGFDSVAAQDFDTDGYCIFPVDEGTACGHICDLCDVGGDDEAAGNARLMTAAIVHERDYEEGVTGCIRLSGAWPCNEAAYKPKTRQRDLISAAALIVAEIERLDREKAAKEPSA
jgi:hypothetical protein